jgi:hypothetical protein
LSSKVFLLAGERSDKDAFAHNPSSGSHALRYALNEPGKPILVSLAAVSTERRGTSHRVIFGKYDDELAYHSRLIALEKRAYRRKRNGSQYYKR